MEMALEFATIAFNASTTFAIVYKTLPVIKTTRRQSFKDINPRFWQSMLAFIENGAMYTVVGVVHVTLLICIWIDRSQPKQDALSLSREVMFQIWQVLSVRTRICDFPKPELI
jgi:hypothetical protein